jgi:Skp family chaperone for outer membrane proteins
MRKWSGYLALLCTVVALAFGGSALVADAAPHAKLTHAARLAKRRAERHADAALRRNRAKDKKSDAAAAKQDVITPDDPGEQGNEELEEKEEAEEEALEQKESEEEEREEQAEEEQEEKEEAEEEASDSD